MVQRIDLTHNHKISTQKPRCIVPNLLVFCRTNFLRKRNELSIVKRVGNVGCKFDYRLRNGLVKVEIADNEKKCSSIITRYEIRL